MFLHLTELSSDVSKECIEAYLGNYANVVHNITMLGEWAAYAEISGMCTLYVLLKHNSRLVAMSMYILYILWMHTC